MNVFLSMIGCTFCFASMTALVKSLNSFPVTQIMFFRCFIALLPPLVYLLLNNQLAILKTKLPLLHLIRGVSGLSAMYFFFLAYQHIGLAEAQAIGRSKAVFISILAVLILKEKLNLFRISIVLLGLVGVIIMLNPTIPKADYYLFYPLLGAFLAAIAMITVRSLSKTEEKLTIVIYFMLFGSIAALSLGFSEWKQVSGQEMILLCGTGLLGVAGQLFMVNAYKIGEASFVAPFDYLELIWACVLGWLFWYEAPTIQIIIGSVLVLLCQVALAKNSRRKTI